MRAWYLASPQHRGPTHLASPSDRSDWWKREGCQRFLDHWRGYLIWCPSIVKKDRGRTSSNSIPNRRYIGRDGGGKIGTNDGIFWVDTMRVLDCPGPGEMLFGKSTAPANGQTSSSGRGGFDTTYASISSTGGSLATTETALRRARLGTEEEEFMAVARG